MDSPTSPTSTTVRFEALIRRIEASAKVIGTPGVTDAVVCRVAQVDNGMTSNYQGKIRARFNNHYQFVYRWVYIYHHVKPVSAATWDAMEYSDQVIEVMAWVEKCTKENLVIAHRCDVPNCIRSDHLMLQTMEQNIGTRGCPGYVISPSLQQLLASRGIDELILVASCHHTPVCTRVTTSNAPVLVVPSGAADAWTAVAREQGVARQQLATMNKEHTKAVKQKTRRNLLAHRRSSKSERKAAKAAIKLKASKDQAVVSSDSGDSSSDDSGETRFVKRARK